MRKLIGMALAFSTLAMAGNVHAATIFSGQESGFIIPLGKNTNSSTISIGTTGAVDSVTFDLNLLAHTAARDLTATITHGGVTAELFSGLGTLRGLLGNYSFAADAPTALKDASGFLVFAPGTYSFTYPVAGSSFLGTDASGDWTLSIADNRFLGVGLLGSWGLSGTVAASTPTTPAVPEPATWAMMMLGLGMVGVSLRRRRNHAVRVSYSV